MSLEKFRFQTGSKSVKNHESSGDLRRPELAVQSPVDSLKLLESCRVLDVISSYELRFG